MELFSKEDFDVQAKIIISYACESLLEIDYITTNIVEIHYFHCMGCIYAGLVFLIFSNSSAICKKITKYRTSASRTAHRGFRKYFANNII